MNKKGSILEVLISSLIFSLVMLGLTNLFLSGRDWIRYNRLRMTAAELSKYYLDELYQQVSNDLWYATGNCTACVCLAGANVTGCDTSSWVDLTSGVTFTPVYAIAPLMGDGNNTLGRLRKVSLQISW